MPRASDNSPLGITIRSAEGGTAGAEIEARLSQDIAARFGPAEAERVVLAAHRGDRLAGGLTGIVHWQWLYIRQLWVDEAERGRGLGTALVEKAVDEARLRGCAGVYVDTFDPRTAEFYGRTGFRETGRIEGFPPGHARIFLTLHLSTSRRNPEIGGETRHSGS